MPTIMLVKAEDAPVPDGPGKWLQFETVTLVNHDHRFGKLEIPEAGKFFHILVLDRTKDDEDMREYLEPVEDTSDPENPVMLKRRRLSIDPEAAIATRVKAERSLTINFAELKAATISH